MTEQQHPLTDEMCESICQNCDMFASQNEIWFQSMRAAADWQLEQVIEWLDDNLHDHLHECVFDEYRFAKGIIEKLKLAMRPQQQQENN